MPVTRLSTDTLVCPRAGTTATVCICLTVARCTDTNRTAAGGIVDSRAIGSLVASWCGCG